VLHLVGSVDAALWVAGSVVRVAWWGVCKVISWSWVLKRFLHFSLVGIVCLIAVLVFHLSCSLRISVSVLISFVYVGLLALLSGFVGDSVAHKVN
jgi:hypothetical protein